MKSDREIARDHWGGRETPDDAMLFSLDNVLDALADARAEQYAECVRLLREAAEWLEQHKPDE